MPQPCSVCALPGRQDVDEALVAGVAYREIAKRNGCSISSLSRHRKDHISPALRAVEAAAVESGGQTTAERIQGLYGRAERILEAAEADGNGGLALSSIRELRSIVELLARITGELDTRPVTQILNVQSSQEWIDLRTTILAALAAYPDARMAVVEALALKAATA
jgi:hypothetical protein